MDLILTDFLIIGTVKTQPQYLVSVNTCQDSLDT